MQFFKIILTSICLISFLGTKAQAIIGKSFMTVANNVEVKSTGNDTIAFKISKGTKFSVDSFVKDTDSVLISF